jgi:hypothetical protein
MDPKQPEFEKKIADICKVRNHTVESLKEHARTYLKDLESHLIQRNGIYEGKIEPKVPKA